jgi:hypothetical protein
MIPAGFGRLTVSAASPLRGQSLTADDADRLGFPCHADTLGKSLYRAADPPIDGDPTDCRTRQERNK